MTKRRAPLSPDAALVRVAGQLDGGFDQLAGLLGRSVSLVRKWADPDAREAIPFADAIACDLLYREQGGNGAPMFECYAHQLDEAGALRFAGQITLGRFAPDFIRETSEATAALVLAAQPGSDDRALRTASRELREAAEVIRQAIQMVEGGQGDLARNSVSATPQGP